MLKLRNIKSGYDQALILKDVSLDVERGQIHCLFGRNGAGKTTLLKTIAGLLPVRDGYIILDNEPIHDCVGHSLAGKGLGYVPQGRRLFAQMSVRENIEIGLIGHKGSNTDHTAILDDVLAICPILKMRLSQLAGTLSGGEQQMLALARALALQPKLLLLDEPTEGLQPSMIAEVRHVIQNMKQRGVSILLVEHRIDAILEIADQVTFIENGRTMDTVTPQQISDDKALLERYLRIS